MKAKDILPAATTVRRRIAAKSESARQHLTETFAKLPADTTYALTTDMWTDSHKQRAYITITIHYINDKWMLDSKVLTTREFTEQKTGTNIRNKLAHILDEFGLNIGQCIFTTDRGSNIVCALKNDTRVDCIAHILNTVVTTALARAGEEVEILLDNCKNLVRYVKKTSLQDNLKKTLKQSCDTRWNSTFTMLHSVKEALPKLTEIFTDDHPRQLHRVTCINTGLLEKLEAFLLVSIIDLWLFFRVQ